MLIKFPYTPLPHHSIISLHSSNALLQPRLRCLISLITTASGCEYHTNSPLINQRLVLITQHDDDRLDSVVADDVLAGDPEVCFKATVGKMLVFLLSSSLITSPAYNSNFFKFVLSTILFPSNKIDSTFLCSSISSVKANMSVLVFFLLLLEWSIRAGFLAMMPVACTRT